MREIPFEWSKLEKLNFIDKLTKETLIRKKEHRSIFFCHFFPNEYLKNKMIMFPEIFQAFDEIHTTAFLGDWYNPVWDGRDHNSRLEFLEILKHQILYEL